MSSKSNRDDYLPARMVNEFVYCPRLFYLMYVEGQFADTRDTVDGQIVHTRVDAGAGVLPSAEPNEEQTLSALAPVVALVQKPKKKIAATSPNAVQP